MPQVSLVATLVATVFGFVLGALWYGPLFGRWWMAAAGATPERLASRGGRPAVTYGVTFVLGFVAFWVFGLYLGPHPGFRFAVVAGAVVGLFWVGTSLATNALFERRPAALMAINAGYHTLRFALAGLAFAWLG